MKQPDIQQTQRAAIYVRVSDPGQADGYSLDTQLEGCRMYAAEHGLTVVIEHLEVHTATELFEREAMTKLRAAMSRREFDHVIVFVLDRLSRNGMHTGLIFSEAGYYGVKIHSVLQKVDETPEGMLLVNITGYVAEKEHAAIRERTLRGQRARLAAGKLKPGRVPLYGYRWRDPEPGAKTSYAIDPATAPVVRRIFTMAACGRTLYGITKALTDDCIPSPSGKTSWPRNTVQQMLRHPAYIGRAVAGRNAVIKEKGRATPRHIRLPEEQHIILPDGLIPPLVDLQTFEAVAARLRINQETASRNNHDPEYALLRGGYALCAYCGRHLQVNFRQPKEATVYCCQNRDANCTVCERPAIRTNRLDAAVWERVELALRQPETIAQQLVALQEHDPTALDVAAVARELAEVERKRVNLARRLGLFDDDEAVAPLVMELHVLAKRKAALEGERDGILVRRQQWEQAQAQLADIEQWCRNVVARLGTLTYPQRRLALDALGVRVRVWKREHVPNWEITATLPLAGDIVSTSGC